MPRAPRATCMARIRHGCVTRHIASSGSSPPRRRRTGCAPRSTAAPTALACAATSPTPASTGCSAGRTVARWPTGVTRRRCSRGRPACGTSLKPAEEAGPIGVLVGDDHSNQKGSIMRRTGIAAALATALAACFAFNAVPAGAAVSSATINQTTATLNLDGADDNETISVANGLLVHSSANAPLSSSAAWDAATQGKKPVPANGSFTVVVNAGAGNDIVTVLARVREV